MAKRLLFLAVLIGAVSLTAAAQELTAREYAKARGVPERAKKTAPDPYPFLPPHACTVSKAHPCVYYGGDPNAKDFNVNGYANENTLDVPNTYTYTEVNVPVATSISASFSNNEGSTPNVFDSQTATWFYRSGVSEGNGGTLLCSGDNPALITFVGDVGDALVWEVLTTTPCEVPSGNVWFTVTPNCINPNDPGCHEEFWEWTTDGTLNAINGKFTVTSNTGMGRRLSLPISVTTTAVGAMTSASAAKACRPES